jgi:hypothetical protein
VSSAALTDNEQTPNCARKTRDLIGQAVLSLVFFALLFLYLWQVVDPRLIYSIGTITNFPVFFTGWDFFTSQVVHAGGVVAYLSALLSQLFYYAWAGALVITLQAWLLAACTGYLLRSAGVPGSRWLRFAPPLLVLAAYNQYSYHFPTTMALLAALLCACLYVAVASRLRPGETPARIGKTMTLFLVLSIVAYLAAAGAYLLFGVLCVIYELASRSRRAGLLEVPVLLLLPCVAAVGVFHSSVADAYTELLPLAWKILGWHSRMHMIGTVYALYLLVPAALLSGALGRYLVRRWQAARRNDGSKKTAVHKPQRHIRFPPAVQWAAQFVVILGLGTGVALVSHNSQEETRLAVHYYACHRMWPQVLQAGAGQLTNRFVLPAVNRALYQTGRLSTNMFSCPQHPDALLPTGDDRVLLYWNKFDALIDLGLLNLAEKNFIECMETFGEHPAFLQRLALINLAKGEIETARVFLGALSRTLFHRAWARHYLALLQSDPDLATDAEIQQMRAVCLKADSVAAFFDKETMLTALLQSNSHNRMAFEYLMAWYMTTKQVAKVAEAVHYMNDLKYTEIPPLYQEAICVYIYAQRKPVQLFGRTINPQTQQQIEQFSQVLRRYGKDKSAALPELAAKYRGSYFLYHMYGPAPLE